MGLRSSSCLLPLLLLVLLVPVSHEAGGTCTYTDACMGQPNCTGCTAGDMVPDPTNCHGFYYCQSSAQNDYFELPAQCPDDQVFDAASGQCVEGQCELCPPVCVYQCDVNTPQIQSISSPDDCTVYYECVAGVVQPAAACPDAAPFFDGINCQAAETRCCRCQLYCDSTDVGSLIIDPLDCRRYWFCTKVGIPVSSATCPDGENFDAFTQQCSATVHCIRQCTNAVGEDGCIELFTCSSTGYFAKCPQQCTQEYYYCEEATGEYVEPETCIAGTVYHPDTHTCVDPDDCPY